MKNRTGLIFTIILLSALIVLLTAFLIASLTSGPTFSWFSLSCKSTNTILDETFALADIQEINLVQEFGDVSICQSTDDTIHVVAYGKKANEIQWNLTQNKLRIQSNRKNESTFWNLNKNDIVVYIPISYANKVILKVDCGTCQIEDFEKASFVIDCDAGNVEMGKIKNANVKCDCGNLEIKEITNQCTLSVDAGNIEISKLSLQENSNMKVDMGNITIGETNSIYIDATVDLGNLTVKQNHKTSDITLTLDCNCGNITIGK